MLSLDSTRIAILLGWDDTGGRPLLFRDTEECAADERRSVRGRDLLRERGRRRDVIGEPKDVRREIPSSTEPIARSARSAAVITVATATRTIVVPTMIPSRYLRECRTPKTEPPPNRRDEAPRALPPRYR